MNSSSFLAFILGAAGSSLLGYLTEPLISLKVIGGSEEYLLRDVAPGLVVSSFLLSYFIFSISDIEKCISLAKRYSFSAFIILTLSLLIKHFVVTLALDEILDRFLWFIRYLFFISYFISIGIALGLAFNIKKNSDASN